MMKALSNPEKNSVSYGQKRTSNAKLIKRVKIAHFFFPCYVRTVRTVYLEDFKPAYAVLHLIKKIKNHWVRGTKQIYKTYTDLQNSGTLISRKKKAGAYRCPLVVYGKNF